MDLLGVSPELFKLFLLVFIRVSVVLFLFPIFGTQMFPTLAKAGFAGLLTLGLLPVVKTAGYPFPDSAIEAGLLIGSEVIIGVILGMIIRMFFAAVQLAGQLISFQMGFAMINVLDPQTGSQVSILDQIGYWVVLLIFLLLNGHHLMISALADSFRIIDIGHIVLRTDIYRHVIDQSVAMFVLAVKIGAPGIVALLFVSAAFGLCAKFAPQMNILIAAFPVKIIVGLFFFGVTFQIILTATQTFVRYLLPQLLSMLRMLAGT